MAESTQIKTDPDSVSENTEPQTDRAQSVKGEQTQQNPKGLESTEGVNALEPESLETDSFLKALIENNQNKAPAQETNQAEVDVEALQQLIEEGADPTQLLEETAAGEGEPTDGGGIYIPTIERTAEEVLADAGFDTTTTASVDVVVEEILINEPPTISVDNDAPVATANTNSISEDAVAAVTGNMITDDDAFGVDSDTDTTDTLTVTNIDATSADQYGTFALTNADGSYSYTIDNNNTAVQALAVGETLTEVYTYTLSDGTTTDTATVTITINGTNDAPVATANTNSISEDAVAAVTGNMITDDDAFGVDSDTDTTDTLTVTNIDATSADQYGTFALTNADGSYSYTIDNNNTAVQALAVGETLTEVYTYTLSDGTTTDTATVTITINGTNDAPVATANTNSISEDAVAAVTGNMITDDDAFGVDSDTDTTDTLTVTNIDATSADQYGTFALTNADGSYSYTIDNNNTAVQALAVGETLTEVYTYTLSDGTTTDTATVTITINGTNDAPVATANTNSISEDAVAAVTGNMITDDDAFGVDSDTDTTDTLTVTNIDATSADQYGTFALTNADGSYSYTIDNNNTAVQALAVGETLTEVYTYTLSDGTTTDTATVTITINGTNDAPVATANTNSISEDAVAAVTGNMITDDDAFGVDSDTDTTDTLTVTNIDATSADQYGTFALTNADGSYSYTIDNNNTAVQALAVGETLTEVYTYTLSDGTTTDTATVTITINGTNDAPVATANTNSISEDAVAAVTGNMITDDDAFGVDSDTDTTDTLTVTNIDATSADQYGTFALTNADGSYSYTIDNNNTAVQALAVGETLTEVYTYTLSDGTTTDTATVTITINGTNDAPVATANTNSISEDAVAAVTGNMITDDDAFGVDSDTDTTDTLTVTNIDATSADQYGTFALTNADGSYSYTIDNNNTAVQALAVGETLTEVYTYTLSDGTTTDTATVTITINGTNDAPTVSSVGGPVRISEEGLLGGLIDNGGASDTTDLVTNSGQVIATDVDTNDTLTYTLSSPPIGLKSGNENLVWSGNGTGTSGLTNATTLTGSVGSLTTIVSVTIGSDGFWSATLSGPIDHSNALIEDDLSFGVTVTVSDGIATDTDTLTVFVEDDSPNAFTPTTLHLIDDITEPNSETGALNFVSGADGVDLVKFTFTDGDPATDKDGNPICFIDSNVEYPLYLHYGTTNNATDYTLLEATTSDTLGLGDLAFSIDIDPQANTFTLLTNGIITNKTATTSSSVASIGGGNTNWTSFIDLGGTEQDALLTTTSVSTINTSQGKIGIGTGQSFNETEGYRIDLVNGFILTSDDLAAITGHNTTNSFRQVVFSIQGNNNTANLTLSAIIADDFIDPFYDDADDLLVSLTKSNVVVYDEDGFIVSDGDDGLAYKDNTDDSNITDGTIVLTGLQADWTFEINSDTAFNAVQVDGFTGTQNFKLGVFSYGENSYGDPVELSYAITGVDGDGDTVDSALAATLYPAGATEEGDGSANTLDGNDFVDYLLGQAGDDTLNGKGGDDILVGGADNDTLDGGNDDDILIGGSGDDALTGGLGNDTFKWQAGETGIDTITDWGTGTNILDLSELLQGEGPNAVAADLDPYLNFSYDTNTSDTTLTIDVDGLGNDNDQVIVFNNVDLTSNSTLTDQAIITNLLGTTQLITD